MQVELNVVGSGVVLISGHIIELITVDDATGTQHRQPAAAIVAGTGYADLTHAGRWSADGSHSRRVATAAPTAAALGGTMRQVLRSRAAAADVSRRRAQACEPCSARVYGDVSGDCSFTSADVLILQELASAVQHYHDGSLDVSPLAAMACDWLREQANPSLDTLGASGALGGGVPKVDLLDGKSRVCLGSEV